MRILLLTTDSYGGHGGIALYNRDIAQALSEISEVSEVIILARMQPLPVEEIPEKVTFVCKSVGSKWNYINALFTVSRGGFDLIICGHVNLLPIAIILNIWLRTSISLLVYGIDVWAPPYRFARQWISKVNSIWSISKITCIRMNEWLENSKQQCILLPNAIHLDKYQLTDKPTHLVDKYNLESKKVIMTLARLSSHERYKGIDEIIEILPDLVKQESKIKYIVVGDGDDKSRLEEKVKRLNLEKYVIFTGFVEEQEKPQYFSLADVFAMPGKGEGFGFVFLEAMASGVPVVGSKVDGSREALREGLLGELVDPHDLNAIKKGILKALEQPRGIPEGLTFFSWQSFSNRLSKAVNQLVLNHG